jgi:hypothetical protein
MLTTSAQGALAQIEAILKPDTNTPLTKSAHSNSTSSTTVQNGATSSSQLIIKKYADVFANKL